MAQFRRSLDPNSFIITRKRKKYKFALFHNSPLCFEFDEWDKQTTVDVLEVGAGTALFSVELAEQSPSKQFVAVDVKADRLQKGARLAEEKGLTNVCFLRIRAQQLTELFQPGSLTSIWITFPDPFPKKRSVSHRLTHLTFLAMYKQLLNSDGSLYLKHDSREFFSWTLEQLVNQKWRITELNFDVHDSELRGDCRTITSYEQRWIDEGATIGYLAAQK